MAREQKAATRSMWSGTISFGLVSIPVDLYAAVQKRNTSMRLVDPKGRPLGRKYYCSEEEKPLSQEELVRGFQTEKGKVVAVTDEELEAIAPDMTRDIELRRFVPADEIPPAYYDHPYFLAPSGRSAKAYLLLAEVMQKTGRVGIGTFVMRGHQYLVAILPENGVLRAQTLRFADEVRSPKDVGLTKPKRVAGKEKKLIAKAVEKLAAKELNMEELADQYAAKLHKLAEQKKEKDVDLVDISAAAETEETEPGGADVIDLMKLLRQRIGASAKTSKAPTRRPPARAERTDEEEDLRTRAHRARKRRRGENLDDLSKAQLEERAQALHIRGHSKMKKAQLIEAIRRAH